MLTVNILKNDKKHLDKIMEKSARQLKLLPVWSFWAHMVIMPDLCSRLCSPVLFQSTCLGLRVKMFFTWYIIALECKKPRGNGRVKGNLIQMNPQLLLPASSRKDVDKVIITAVCVLLLPAFSLREQKQLVQCKRWGGRWESGAHWLSQNIGNQENGNPY